MKLFTKSQYEMLTQNLGFNLAAELDAKGLAVTDYDKAVKFVRAVLSDYLDDHLTDILTLADCGLLHLDELEGSMNSL